jgi:hypothetical protein
VTDERELAERAMAALHSPEPGRAISWPAVAERIRTARQYAGLTEEQVANRAHLTSPSNYWDLELQDDEAFTCISIAGLHAVASVLGTTGSRLLFGEDLPPAGGGQEFATIAKRLKDRIAAQGLTVEALGDEIGWDLQGVLHDPFALAGFNLVGLRDVCKLVGVDWVGAFLAAGTPPPETEVKA